MGLVYADIELVNPWDLENARRHIIDQDEVRHINVNMLVDRGAYMMAINENIQEYLDLTRGWCPHHPSSVSNSPIQFYSLCIDNQILVFVISDE